MKALILAGGLGTRLRPFTHTGPKQLIPVANKPVIYYCIEDIRDAGIRDIGIIVGYTAERINAFKKAIGDGSRWGLRVTYIEQDAPRGLAHAVYCGREFIGDDPFIVYLGDNMLKEGITEFVKYFKDSDADAAILLSEVDEPEKYGVAVLDENQRLVDLEEKPEQPKSNLVLVGVYLFTPKIFDAIEKIKPSPRGELELTEAIRTMLRSGKHKISYYLVEGWWDDTGTAEAVLRANHMVLSEIKTDIKGTVEKGVNLIGNVQLGEGSVIKKGSTIRGPVLIGKNCIIGPTYIGPYTSVGNNTCIAGGEIESSIIIGDSHITLDKKIVDSLIGRHTVIESSDNVYPKGCRFIVGENTRIQM